MKKAPNEDAVESIAKTKKDKLAAKFNALEQYEKDTQELFSGLLAIMTGKVRRVTDTTYLPLRKFSKRKDLTNLLNYAKDFWQIELINYRYGKDGIIVFDEVA